MNANVSTELYQPEFFRLLSSCFLLPDDHLSQTIISLEYLIDEIYPQIIEDSGKLRDSFDRVCDIEQLQVEYTRLFIGPYKMLAPPYESVYRDGKGLMMGDSTMNVLQLYNEAGFKLDDNHSEGPDHIATELEFLYVLLAKQTTSRLNREVESIEKLGKLLSSLLIDHLACWIPELTHCMETKSDSEFYKALARVTRNTVLYECKTYDPTG